MVPLINIKGCSNRKEYLKKKLYQYLGHRFYADNHPKYHHFFKEWFNNLSLNQLNYFYKDLKNQI